MSASLVHLSAPTASTSAASAASASANLPGGSTAVIPRLCGEVRVEFEAEGPVLWLRGEVDAAVVQAFESRWTGSPPPLIAIDAGEATFVDSSGVTLLFRWAQAASILGTTAVLRRSSPRLDRVLELLGLKNSFTRPYRTRAHPARATSTGGPSAV